MLTALVDLDYPKYAVASMGQENWIEIVHTPTGKSKEFPGRREFWGRKGNGGWFKEVNKSRVEKGLKAFEVDEFEIVDKSQISEPIENILYTAKAMVENALEVSGADNFEAYYGQGASFRHSVSTLLEYKGNRTGPKPLMLEEVTNYLSRTFKGEMVTGIETDDKLTMIGWKNNNKFIIGNDKDYRGCGSRYFDVNNPDEGIIDTNCFGKLWRNDNGKVKGYGRMFKLWQVCSKDDVDNYRANCFSDKKWGDVKAYTCLVDSKNDKELFENAVQVFKILYPEPITVHGWRGDSIDIDWLYVFQECMDMAHMQRWHDDRVIVKDVLNQLGVEYNV